MSGRPLLLLPVPCLDPIRDLDVQPEAHDLVHVAAHPGPGSRRAVAELLQVCQPQNVASKAFSRGTVPARKSVTGDGDHAQEGESKAALRSKGGR